MKKIFLINAIILLCLTISYPSFASTSLPQEATSKICVGFYVDKNRNGFRDPAETIGNGGWFFESSTLSGGSSTNKNYSCRDLPPDEYTITVNLNYLDYQHYSLTTQSEIKVTLLPTSQLVLEFGLSPTELCIVTFRDENKNGAKDEGEKFVEGIEFTVLGADRKPIHLSQNKTNNISYCVLVEPGNYQIEITVPPDYVTTTQTTWNKSVAVDTTENIDFGIAPKNEATAAVIQTPKTQICVSVYSDLNDNGTKDKGDGLVKDAFVEILDSYGKRVTEFTTNGLSEPNCTIVEAGHYQIQVKEPEGYQATTKLYWELDIQRGGEAILEFGVQKNSAVSNNTTLSPAFMRAFLATIGILCLTIFIPSPFILMFILGQRIKLSDKTSSRLSKVFHVINIGSGIVSAIIIIGTWLLTQDATARGVVSILLGIMLAISLTGEMLLRTRFQ